VVECVWNMMAHAQKPDFVFRRNGWVHLNRRGRQFSQLLAAEVCASALVMLDTQRSEVVWEYWLPTPFARFPFTSPPVRQRVPSGFKRTLSINSSLLTITLYSSVIATLVCNDKIFSPFHDVITEFDRIQHSYRYNGEQSVVKEKGKSTLEQDHESPEGEQMYSSTLPSTPAIDGGGLSTPRPGRFTPEKDPVPIV